jgi:hypothetical protein
LDADEKKLILGLSQRGFLPKDLVLEPLILESSVEESNLSVHKKQKSTEY